jgi:hypothetical protein
MNRTEVSELRTGVFILTVFRVNFKIGNICVVCLGTNFAVMKLRKFNYILTVICLTFQLHEQSP